MFIQNFKPIGTPSGKTIVMSPGFLESGRNDVEQAQLLNKAGHEVVVLDHQWAGLSSGNNHGGIDRGRGVATDTTGREDTPPRPNRPSCGAATPCYPEGCCGR